MGKSEVQHSSHAGMHSVFKKWNWITLMIAAANLIVYLLMLAAGAFDATNLDEKLIVWGAVVGDKIIAGEVWRLFDCLFVHVGLRHFLGNMCALFLAAPFLISAIGSFPTALVYVACGMLGNVAAGVTDPTAVVIGASGAIFGLYGALVATYLSGKFGSHSEVDRRQLRQAIVLSLPLSLLTSSLPGISFAANLGGMVSGFLLGFALTRKTFPARYSWAPVSIFVSFIGIFIVTAIEQGPNAAFLQTIVRTIQSAPAGQMRDPARANVTTVPATASGATTTPSPTAAVSSESGIVSSALSPSPQITPAHLSELIYPN